MRGRCVGVRLIESAPHEFAAHLLFDEYGLDPFFACDRRVKDGDGSLHAEFEYEGETWEVTLSYRDSGLKHPGPRLPSGTEFRLNKMREFDLHVQSADDPVGQRSFHAHLAPRWQGMRATSGEEISVPEMINEAVNLHVQGSNIEFAEYLPLVQRAARALRIDSVYFREAHEFSTILDAERYVRLHEDAVARSRREMARSPS